MSDALVELPAEGVDAPLVSLTVKPSSQTSLLATVAIVAVNSSPPAASPSVETSDLLGLAQFDQMEMNDLEDSPYRVEPPETVDAQLMEALGLEPLGLEPLEPAAPPAPAPLEPPDALDEIWDELMAAPLEELPPMSALSQTSAADVLTSDFDQLAPVVEEEEEEENQQALPYVPPYVPAAELTLLLTLQPTFEISEPAPEPSDVSDVQSPHVPYLVAAIESASPPEAPEPPPSRPTGFRRRGGPPTAVLMERMSVK